jgi:UDPglucose--hexose-1-phosphate uridylyltransferase
VDRDRSGGELFVSMTGAGEHEVILETGEHGVAMSELEVGHLQEILLLYRERLLFLRQDNRFRHLAIVKNEGLLAGACANHAHAEVFALPLVPSSVKEKLLGIQGHHRRTGSCVYCDLVKSERTEKTRRVAESIQHIAFAPYASRSPFEVWLLPKGHHGDFATSADGDLADLAALLSEVLRRIDCALDGPAYQLSVETAPLEVGGDPHSFHWHLEIRPALLMRKELGGVIDVNPVPPEEAARALREATRCAS